MALVNQHGKMMCLHKVSVLVVLVSAQIFFNLSLTHKVFAQSQRPESQSISVVKPISPSMQSLIAEESSDTSPECSAKAATVRVMVSVRSLEASGAGELKSLPRELEDLRDQLAKLNFTSFKLLGRSEKSVPLLKKEKLNLTSGQSLVVRALYAEDDGRVGVWLRWRNAQGANLLDTRMHFDSGESMVTGAESEDGQQALVLAISVANDSHLTGN